MTTLRVGIAKAITATLLLSATVPARAGFVGLGDPANAASYNEFILGNSTRTNVDSQGMVAVGGNASFTNFTIDNLGHGSNALVVGGNLTGSSRRSRGTLSSAAMRGIRTRRFTADSRPVATSR